jgi:hypothetical protein
MDMALLKRHDLAQLRSGTTSLVKTVESPVGPFSVDLRFLSGRPKLARVLANSFWITYQSVSLKTTARRTANVLKLFHRFLNYRKRSQPDIEAPKQLSTDLLKEFAVWLVAKHRLKRKSAAGIFAACCCFLRRARRLFSEEFDAYFSTPKNVFAGADNDRSESRALSRSDFQKILRAAENDIRQIRETHRAGGVPTCPQHLIPFMVIIAARTGINPKALCDLERDCLSPHELDENLFYCTWYKPRAGKPQRQLHRADLRNHSGIVELIQFLRQYTEPLVSMASSLNSKRLFLYFSKRASRNGKLLSPSTSPGLLQRDFRRFTERHRLPAFTLASIRPTAATQLYLETGGNLRKVQQFLQHAHLRTTVNYVLNSITESFNARAIQKAQEQMIRRVTVVAATRSEGVKGMNLAKAHARKIVTGQFDTGCGTCRNPYESPQPGEEKDRPCTSFHACFTCPNGLWFLDDLPQVIATRNRLVSLRCDMKADDWDAMYGESVHIIEHEIIAAFQPEQVEIAEMQASAAKQRPIIVAKGLLA